METVDDGISKVLFDANRVKSRVIELGAEISLHYKSIDAPLVIIGLLRGSFVFIADLVRAIEIPIEVDFMTVSSYGNAMNGSEVRILRDVSTALFNRDVLIVEDVVDTGMTLYKIVKMLETRNPNSLRVCTLLNKAEKRQASVEVSFNGFDIGDEFVVGYGIDYAQKYRNLPYIGVVS